MEDDLKCKMTYDEKQPSIALCHNSMIFFHNKEDVYIRLSLFLKMLKHYDIVGKMCASLTCQSFKTKYNLIPTKIPPPSLL